MGEEREGRAADRQDELKLQRHSSSQPEVL